MKRLNDIFPQWQVGAGIFSFLQTFPIPWQSEGVGALLDIEYHGNISGEKPVSPLCAKIIAFGDISDNDRSKLAQLAFSLYGAYWEKQWQTLLAQYNPIENYSMIEQMANDITAYEHGKTTTRTDDLTHTKTGTDTRTDNLTDTNTPATTTNIADKIHGFNSALGIPANEQTNTTTGTDTTTHSGTEQHQYNLSDTDTGTQSIRDTGTDTQTRNYRLTRSGNIGVTTSQQMLQSERELWQWNFFRDVVFPNLDSILTLRIY